MRYYKIFFPVLVLLLLVIPLFHMNMSEITEQENRTLAKFPEIKKKNKLNESYGKDFESWLGDRFWGRDQLINVRFKSLYKINGRIENEKAFIGDDGWMFEKSQTVYVPSLKNQRKQIEKDVQTLKKIINKFKGKNIPIYLVIGNNREMLYQKYWERYYKPSPRLSYEKEIIQRMSDYHNVKIIPVQDELEKMAEEELIFFKDDSHLTNLAKGFIIQKIFQKMAEDRVWEEKNVVLKSVKEIKTQEYVANISAKLGLAGKTKTTSLETSLQLSGLTSKILETRAFVVQEEDNVFKGGIVRPYVKSVNDKAPVHKTGIFLGSCYAEDAYDVLAPLFKTAFKIRHNVQEMGEDAVSFMRKKIDELSDVEQDSIVVMIIGQWSLGELEKLINE